MMEAMAEGKLVPDTCVLCAGPYLPHVGGARTDDGCYVCHNCCVRMLKGTPKQVKALQSLIHPIRSKLKQTISQIHNSTHERKDDGAQDRKSHRRGNTLSIVRLRQRSTRQIEERARLTLPEDRPYQKALP